jgi:hypothetical protein
MVSMDIAGPDHDVAGRRNGTMFTLIDASADHHQT